MSSPTHLATPEDDARHVPGPEALPQGENGACFESDFSAGGIRVNDSQHFVGRSD